MNIEIKSSGRQAKPLQRKSFPPDVETAVLIRCKRRCALCFAFDNDNTTKAGQIAHIDRNPGNASLENAAYLCMEHHDEYDSRPSQSKRLTPNELTYYQTMLYDFLGQPGPWPSASRLSRQRRAKTVSLAVYERRISTYRAVVKFVRYVLQDMHPAYKEIFQFVAETDEALFLFDGTIADYLGQISKRAVRLHAVAAMLDRAYQPSLGSEQTELADWFSKQFEEAKTRFAPFLQLGTT